MDTLRRVPISNSPGFLDIVRKVAILGNNQDFLTRTVTLRCRVEHYASDGTTRLPNTFAVLERTEVLLTATDEDNVDATTGALVAKDTVTGEFPAGSVPQFTWLIAAVESGANQFTLMEGAIIEADTRNRFN